MKIRVDKKWWNHYVRGQAGKTQSEKESRAECIFSSPGRSWAKGMGAAGGEWLEVETKYVFSDAFNACKLDGGLMHVDAKFIDRIDFAPEFKDLDDFQAAVQKRYAKDWPGSKVQCRVLRSYMKSGFIVDVTGKGEQDADK